MSLSRKLSQTRSGLGACSTEPDQPAFANSPLTSAKVASCRKKSSVTPGPFEKVNSKSPPFEKRTSTSPVSVVFAVRYMSCPLLFCQLPAGSENWCREVVTQLVTQNDVIAKSQIRQGRLASITRVFALIASHQPLELTPAILFSPARACAWERSDNVVAARRENKTPTSAILSQTHYRCFHPALRLRPAVDSKRAAVPRKFR